jgi:hypothetical protein
MSIEPKWTDAPFQPNSTKLLARPNGLEWLAFIIGLAFCSTGAMGAVIGVPIVLAALYSAFLIPPKVNRGLYIGKCPHCGAELSATHYQTVVDCPSCTGDVKVGDNRFIAIDKPMARQTA